MPGASVKHLVLGAAVLLALAACGARAVNTCDKNLFINPSYYVPANCNANAYTYTCGGRDDDYGACCGKTCPQAMSDQGYTGANSGKCSNSVSGRYSCFLCACSCSCCDKDYCSCSFTAYTGCASCKQANQWGSTCQGVCPANCGSFGSCSAGPTGTGLCICPAQYAFNAQGQCSLCAAGRWGPTCAACPSCGSNGRCNDGLAGNGQCTCNAGFTTRNDANNIAGTCNGCLDGYGGASCTACPRVNGVICNGQGTCLDGSLRSGQCSCNPGWNSNTNCATTTCGDSIRAGLEQCDLGSVTNNAQNGCCSSGCSYLPAGTNCTTATTPNYCTYMTCNALGGCAVPVSSGLCVCGNGRTDPGEACDTGAGVNNPVQCTYGQTGCSGCYQCNSVTSPNANVLRARCGDGVITTSWPGLASAEQCDDGNSASGDGCSNTCQIETGYTCPTAGSLCTSCAAFKFGTLCTQNCACVQANTNSCNNVDGTCSCKSPWIGTNCDALPAPSGTQLTLSPSTINVGDSTTSITFTGAFASSLTQVAFLPGVVASCPAGSVVSRTSLTSSSTRPLSAGLTTATVYSVCYSQDGGNTFVLQTATLTAVAPPATTSSISAISPATSTTNVATSPITFSGAIPSSTTQVAFTRSTSACTNLLGVTSLPNTMSTPPSAVIVGPFSDTGIYRLCYSTDSGTSWVLQASANTILTISASPPSAGSIDSVSPTQFTIGAAVTIVIVPNFGCGTAGDCAFVGSTTSYIAFIPGSSVDCSTSRLGVTRVQVTDEDENDNYVVTIPAGAFGSLQAGFYRMCYSSQDDVANRYQFQSRVVSLNGAAIEVVPEAATANTIMSISPSSVNVLTPVTFTYAGLQPSVHTFVSFLVPGKTDCSVSADRLLQFNANAATTAYALAGTFSSAGTYGVCLSVTGASGTWVLQTATVAVLARPATAASISSVVTSGSVPNSGGAFFNVSASFSFVGGDGSSTSWVGFVLAGSSNCQTSLYGVTAYTSAVVTIQDETWLPGVYSLCYSTSGNDPANFVLQTATTAANNPFEVDAPPPTETTITLVDPDVLVVRASANVEFVGAIASASTRVALTRTTCAVAELVATTTLTSSTSATVSVPNVAGTYSVCYSTGAQFGWVKQTLVSVTVVPVAASATSISTLSPPSVTVLSALPVLTLGGADASGSTFIGFSAAAGDCSAVAVKLATAYTSAGGAAPSGQFGRGEAGVYTVCYSTDGGATYAAQTGVTLQVNAPAASTGIVASLDDEDYPELVTNVLYTTADGAPRRFSMDGVTPPTVVPVPSASSYIRLLPSGANCSSATGVTVAYDGLVSVLPATFTNYGVYRVCYSTDGGNSFFLQQSGATVTFTPPPAQATDVSATLTLTARQTSYTISLSGYAYSPTTQVAFVRAGQACTAANLLPSAANPGVFQVQADGTVSIVSAGGNLFFDATPAGYSLCYSTTYGATFYEGSERRRAPADNGFAAQTNVALTVVPGVASTLSLTAITPAVFFVGQAGQTFAVTGGVPSSLSQFAFIAATATPTCTPSAFVTPTYALTDGAAVYTLAPAFAGSGQYLVCYASDGAETWALQSTLQVQAIPATPTATTVTGVTPSSVEAVTAFSATVAGLVPSGTSQFAFVRSNETTCNARLLETAYTGAPAAVSGVFGSVGVYHLCVSTNGGQTWVKQTSTATFVTATVPPATADKIEIVNPSTITLGSSPTFAFVGASSFIPSPTTIVGFSLSATCAASGVEATIRLTSALSGRPAAALGNNGTYYLCLSTDNGVSYVAQTSDKARVSVEVEGTGSNRNPDFNWNVVIIPSVIVGVLLIVLVIVTIILFRRRQARLDTMVKDLFDDAASTYTYDAHTSSNPLYEANSNWRFEDNAAAGASTSATARTVDSAALDEKARDLEL